VTEREPFRLFAVAAPGLEPLLRDELTAIGVQGRLMPGGVEFDGSAKDMYRANLHSAIASRVLVRCAEFRVTNFAQLERFAARVPWNRWLSSQPVSLRVTCRKSRLYHSDAVAERVARAMDRRPETVVDAGDEDAAADAVDRQLFVVRLDHDVCSISADSSGELLHRRGYRMAIGKAPLRETLAAAMLRAVGWPGEGAGGLRGPLVDPFCGSGTIAIEGACRARGIPPGSSRCFAFESWPTHDPALWDRLRQDARARVLPSCPVVIRASDRDAGAIEAARANADRAGVTADITFEQRAISAIEPPPSVGWVITNPPYGARARGGADLRDLYARFGSILRVGFAGWHLAMLAADPRLAGQVGLGRLRCVFSTTNGGIAVQYLATERPVREG
jgi:putative N6-adenine-specific DNA methylase